MKPNFIDATKEAHKIAIAFKKLKNAAEFSGFNYMRFYNAMFPDQARKLRHYKRYKRMMKRGKNGHARS